MKLLNTTQIQQWDAYTIKHEPVLSVDLMERAAQQCTNFIIENNFFDNRIKIFCGKGNNGGDGLAIARQLIAEGIMPFVYIIEFGAKGTDDFQINLHRLHEVTANIFFIQSEEFFPEIDKDDIVVDALFGSGLNRPLEGLYKKLIEHIDQSEAKIISIDVPSGLFIDKSSEENTVIKAAYTLTFQTLKLCFLVAENAVFFGEVIVLDIGLSKSFLETAETVFELTTHENISQLYQPRKQFSHKGTYGHALLVAGNKGKMGAAVLAAKACLRAGVGLLTVNIPEESLTIIQISVPEAMAVSREEKISAAEFTTVGIGPGMGTAPQALQLFQQMMHENIKPMVIDADALNILSQNKYMLNSIAKQSILTPHPKEFDRLFGNSPDDFERLDKAITLSLQYPFIIVLKNHSTLIAANGKGFFNTTGNAGMATGGSGDALTGILTSLLAQDYEPLKAALLGVYIHGLSADIALEDQSMESLLPSDIISHLGKAFHQLGNEVE